MYDIIEIYQPIICVNDTLEGKSYAISSAFCVKITVKR